MAEVSEKIVNNSVTESKQPKFGHHRRIGGSGVKIPNSRAASLDNAVIERKNKQLNQTTKQLEEKVKSLQERSKTRSLPRVSKVKFLSSSFLIVEQVVQLEKCHGEFPPPTELLLKSFRK